MSGPIQTLPRGLLGLLQLKQTGKNPAELADQVWPVLPLFDFYINSIVQDLFSLTGGNVTKTVSASSIMASWAAPVGGLVVPQGQIWYVVDYGIECTLLAAEYIRFHCSMITGSVSTGIQPVGADYNDVITARARVASARASGPFWLAAGGTLGFTVLDIVTGATINVQANARIAAFQI